MGRHRIVPPRQRSVPFSLRNVLTKAGMGSARGDCGKSEGSRLVSEPQGQRGEKVENEGNITFPRILISGRIGTCCRENLKILCLGPEETWLQQCQRPISFWGFHKSMCIYLCSPLLGFLPSWPTWMSDSGYSILPHLNGRTKDNKLLLSTQTYQAQIVTNLILSTALEEGARSSLLSEPNKTSPS